jgi:hypothetical protein
LRNIPIDYFFKNFCCKGGKDVSLSSGLVRNKCRFVHFSFTFYIEGLLKESWKGLVKEGKWPILENKLKVTFGRQRWKIIIDTV